MQGTSVMFASMAAAVVVKMLPPVCVGGGDDMQVFNPRLFVVKSYQLKRLINRCQLFFCPSNHKQQTEAPDGAGSAVAQEAAAVGLVD